MWYNNTISIWGYAPLNNNNGQNRPNRQNPGYQSRNYNNNGANYRKNPPRLGGYQSGNRQNPPGEKSRLNPYLLIEIILLIFAIAADVMFCSFLGVDYHVNYVYTNAPTRSKQSKEGDPSEKIYEREIPVKDPVTEPDGKTEYDFTSPVPECDAYPIDYFSDTIFIGDSRTAGLIMYTKVNPINCSATGFNLRNLEKKYITYTDENGTKSLVSCYEALELYNGRYKSVYISTGVNELGWNASVFIKAYEKAIDSIREITDVPIYIQLILPVTTAYEQKSQNGITNEKQVQFNEKLKTLIAEKEVFMLDPLPLFSTEEGTLDPDVTYDGAHLEKFACATLLEYYQTHVVETEKYSNLADSEPAE